MRVSKVTSGTEADRILSELYRAFDGRPGVTARREDENTVEIVGADRAAVDEILNLASFTWPIHVRVEEQ
jgi:hypothetical protein